MSLCDIFWALAEEWEKRGIIIQQVQFGVDAKLLKFSPYGYWPMIDLIFLHVLTEFVFKKSDALGLVAAFFIWSVL